MTDEERGVVDDCVVDAGGERFLETLHRRAHFVRRLDRVRPRTLKDADGHRVLVVEEAAQRVLIGPHLHPADVADAGDLAVRSGPHHDVREFVFRGQTSLRVDRELEGRAARRGRCAQHSGSDLQVLLADGPDHVGGRELPGGQFVRIEPYAHAVFAGPEHLRGAHTRNARQLVLHAQMREVREIQHVVAVVGREKVHDHDEVGRGLLGGHADALHFGRQPRQCLRHAVLHLHLRVVEISAGREGHGEREPPVGRRLREHVEHAFDPVERLLERSGHALGDHFRIGAGIGGMNDHRRRRHARVFADRQLHQSDAAADHDQ